MIAFVLVDWLQPYSHPFYVAKGLLALTATILLVQHMATTWHSMVRPAQRMRYYALLSASAFFTFASVEQVHDDAVVNLRNLLAMAVVLMLLSAAAVSVYGDRRFSR